MSYTFNEKRHIHQWDGKNLHGVTSVLRNWGDPGSLVNWAANQAVDAIERKESPEEARKAHLKVRDKAGDKGKEVHAQLESALNEWAKTKEVRLTIDAVVNAVLEWLRTEGYTPLRAEFPVYNLDLWYAGIMDAVVEKEGKKYILDFKTSGSVQTKFFYQCGAYSLAIKNMKAEAEIAGAIIVHIPRGTSFKPDTNVYIRYDMGELEQAFANILAVYKLDQEITKLIKY
jgi:ribosomal protein L27